MMLVALVLDVVIGWPGWLYRRVRHPETWLGRLITWADDRFNPGGTASQGAGIVLCGAILLIVAFLGFLLMLALPGGLLGIVLGGILAWPLIAARSMHDHVEAVRTPLSSGDLPRARQEVAMIVGRETAGLDDTGVARAAIESLAENTSDGIIAPLFWGAIAGFPGIAAYKALNTLDSMIGHRTPRHEAFGWASARLDDIANLIPARLTAALFALGSGQAGTAWRVVREDARRHRSPNAGWPEAAMAGGLGVRVSGPRSYQGRQTEEPFVNAGCPDPTAHDLTRALRLYRICVGLAGVLLVLVAMV